MQARIASICGSDSWRVGPHPLDWRLLLVADVDEAALRPREQPAEDHAFEHEMRGPQEQLAVLERARLALVAVDDDELLAPPRLADVVPLLVRRHARAAHPAEVG